MHAESRGQGRVGDARSHRAGTEDGDLADLAGLRRPVDAGNSGRLAFGEKCVAQAIGLRRRFAFHESLPLERAARFVVELHRGLDALDDLLR